VHFAFAFIWMDCKVMMVLQVFGVGSFWGEQAGFTVFWYYPSSCHPCSVLHPFKTEPYKPPSKSYVTDFIVVSSCKFWICDICIFSVMVREEQCGFPSPLFFQDLFTDCIRARICCAFICFRLDVVVLPLWSLVLWPWYGFATLVTWLCVLSPILLLFFLFLWIWVGRCIIPYVVAFSVAPLMGEQPRGYCTGFCSSSLSSLRMVNYSAKTYAFSDMYTVFNSNCTIFIVDSEFPGEKPCCLSICWQYWCQQWTNSGWQIALFILICIL